MWWADAMIAAAAGALFAVHPLNAETVNYISARSSALATCAGLAALGAYTAWRRGAGRSWWIAAFVSAVVALGAKESAITLPVLMWLADAMVIAPTDSWKVRLSRMWPWGLLVGCYLAARFLFVSDLTGGLGYSAGDRSEALVTGLWIVWLAARDFWWPWFLSVEHGVETVRGAAAWVAVGTTFVAIALVVWAWPRRDLLRDTVAGAVVFGVSWWVVAASPTLALPLLTHVALYQEQRFYLASVGFITIAGWLVTRGGRVLAPRTGPAVPVVLFGMILAGLAVLSHNRSVVWKSEVALWSDAAAKAPRSALAHAMLGAAYLDLDRPDLAVPPLERAVQLDATYPLAATNLGAAYVGLDRWEEAIVQYRRALTLDPDFDLARSNLALAYERAGRWIEAMAEYEPLAQRAGREGDIRLRIGALALRADDLDKAEASFQRVLVLDPSAYAALFNLGLVNDRRGRALEAERFYQRARAVNPADPDVHYRLGALAARAGRAEEAVREFETALAHDSRHFSSHYDLARLVDALGRRDQAVAHYRRFLETVPAVPAWASARQEAASRLIELGTTPGAPGPLRGSPQ
jgi:tetratricopeptide (TPR) repeat protein